MSGALARRQGAAAVTPWTAWPDPPAIRLDEVRRVFGSGAHAVAALDGVSLAVGLGEFVCVVGGSGCGKSTLLSLIAGLDRPTSGRVEVDGGRPALMFQDAGLLPWLTVAGNVELPMRLRGARRGDCAAEVDRLLRLVRLDGAAPRRPHQLSGGMRQRVALARALAQRSEVLLMDEPFAAVDAITRDLLHEDLARIATETAITVVLVTHDVREAVRLGDRVVLLSSRPGRVAEEFDVDLPRPRRSDDPAVATLSQRITARLREEVARHGRG
ncbi:MAG TPA: ABC transporter ATP-binding protein [Candidatus Dormibacteraeota bacterium]|nr:ABC transporter ATP-binding protein [Candidatus Dormibacteraeota bacterium]